MQEPTPLSGDHGGPQAGIAPRVAKTGRSLLLRLLPRNRAGDYLYCLILFVYRHRRLPRRGSGLFYDHLFFVKTGDLDDPLRQITTDKVYAKHFIDRFAGRKVTPETYAVFDSVDAIRRSDLPDRCVLKPAHGGGGNAVLLESAENALSEADYAWLRRVLATDLYAEAREANYRYLKKRIICEELIGERGARRDYRLFCYRGAVKFVQVAYQHPLHGGRTLDFYDRHWNELDLVSNNLPRGEGQPMPRRFAEMCAIAERIAAHFESLRVDMYLDGDRVRVGELTHCHLAAQGRFASIEQERRVSEIMFA